jgi:hypothetical protein
MMKSIDEKKEILMEKERMANELSLLQSQLTDSHSKLRQCQTELAITKRELEEKKSVITDITETNLRLINDNVQLRQNVEDSERYIAFSRAIALQPLARPWTHFQEYQGDHEQITPHKTLSEPQNCHGDLPLKPLSEDPPCAVESKDVLGNMASEEVDMICPADEKDPNELYPWSLLKSVRSFLEPFNFENQDLVDEKDPNELYPWSLLVKVRSFLEPANSEKPDLAQEKEKDSQFPSKPGDPQILPDNPKKSDFFRDLFRKKDKPESQRKQTVLEKPKEIQVQDVPKTQKQSIKQNIKKSLLSIKLLFNREVVPESDPIVETCKINGKTFPVYNWEKGFKIAAVNFNVWESIGKPEIFRTKRIPWVPFCSGTLTSLDKEFVLNNPSLATDGNGTTLNVLGETKVEIVINNKTKFMPILVINNPAKTDAIKALFIGKSANSKKG